MRRLYVMLVSVMSVMIATLLIAAATGAAAAHDQRGPTTERIYGAQWVSPSLGSSYFASARDLSAAIERTGSECERAATDCAPGVWVKNGYASLAMDVSGAWGTGWGKYEPSANSAAVADCEFNGGVACSVLQTNKTASYNSLGLTDGGTLPAAAGWGGGGGGGFGTPTATASQYSASPTATASPTASGLAFKR